ncbi:MAG: hypothetical protein AAGK98_04160 [Pseudomonadota bacterium]
MVWSTKFDLVLDTQEIEIATFDTGIDWGIELELDPIQPADTDIFVFEPTAISTTVAGTGSASASFSGFASGSGVSSISVSASSFVANDGQSGSTLDVSVEGDVVGGTGTVTAGTEYETIDFGIFEIADFEPVEIDILEPILVFEPFEFTDIDTALWL